MPKTFETAGDTWRAYIGEDKPHPGILPLIFHCTSNPSNGWRVVEVPEDEFEWSSGLDGMPDSELADLFGRAQPFDFAHDPKSRENSVGDSTPRKGA